MACLRDCLGALGNHCEENVYRNVRALPMSRSFDFAVQPNAEMSAKMTESSCLFLLGINGITDDPAIYVNIGKPP